MTGKDFGSIPLQIRVEDQDKDCPRQSRVIFDLV